MNYCISCIGDYDLLIQNDTQDDGSDDNLCSGFMFIKSNKNTLNFFNPEIVKAKSERKLGWGDQVYINKNKEQLSYSLLPLALFLNGKYFEQNHFKISPYIIHFNWLIGHTKSRMIIKYKEYYSTTLLCLFIKNILMIKYEKLLKLIFL